MHNRSDIFEFHFFADDTRLLYVNKSFTPPASLVNRELKNFTKTGFSANK